MAGRRGVRVRSFSEERARVSTWVVCAEAAIPFGTPALAEKYLAEKLPCCLAHEVVTLNLLPINYAGLRRHFEAHAFSLTSLFSDGPVAEPMRTVTGVISLFPGEYRSGPEKAVQAELLQALGRAA